MPGLEKHTLLIENGLGNIQCCQPAKNVGLLLEMVRAIMSRSLGLCSYSQDNFIFLYFLFLANSVIGIIIIGIR
jgi:hypothetical protein